MSSGPGPGNQPSEQELQAALEAELKRLRVEQVVLESGVSLLNLGMRRAGVVPGTEDERDLDQAQLAVDAVRALMPMLERLAPQQAPQLREALSQLQLAYVRGREAAGQEPAGGEPAGGEQPAAPGEPGAPAGEPAQTPGQAAGEGDDRGPGPAESSGRLWVPGR